MHFRPLSAALILLALAPAAQGKAKARKGLTRLLFGAQSLLLQNRGVDARDTLDECWLAASDEERPSLARVCIQDADVNEIFKPIEKSGRLSAEGALQARQLGEELRAAGFTAMNVQRWFGVDPEEHPAGRTPGPFYVRCPSLPRERPELAADDHLGVLVHLFILGFAVRADELKAALPDAAHLLSSLGVTVRVSGLDLVFSRVSLFPVDVNAMQNAPTSLDVVLATDWNPNWGASPSLEDPPVMYIGPDSLALVAQSPLQASAAAEGGEDEVRLLDVCAGSGIQGLCAAKLVEHRSRGSTGTATPYHVTFLDISPRALRFCAFNAALNGVENVEMRVSDALSAVEEADRFHGVLGNPPFVPVPPAGEDGDELRSVLRSRYSWFADGGADGEAVLGKIVRESRKHLHKGGWLALVTEVLLPRADNGEGREERWATEWGKKVDAWCGAEGYRSLLCCNDPPLDAETYAQRRSGSDEEVKVWREHLEKTLGCDHVSTALLYVFEGGAPAEAAEGSGTRIFASGALQLACVERTEEGHSLWTPQNRQGQERVLDLLRQGIGSPARCS